MFSIKTMIRIIGDTHKESLCALKGLCNNVSTLENVLRVFFLGGGGGGGGLKEN